MTARYLTSWLEGLAADGVARVLLGGTGHLILSPDEEGLASRELEQRALPCLNDSTIAAEIQVITGMAPGADLLIAETAAGWLSRRGRPFRRISLLPVPPEVLWGDWLTRAGLQDAARITAMRARFDAALRASDTVVQLWDEPSMDWSAPETRQRQYRRLAAVLAEQCEVLVAILRPKDDGQPGGTAELVTWRANRRLIPPELSSGPRLKRPGWPADDLLIDIDPTVQPRARQSDPPWIRPIRDAQRAGNYLLAYDRVLKAEQQGLHSDALQYLKLQTLANAGSTHAALRMLSALPAAVRGQNEDWLALEGRLYKDLAMRGGPGANAHFQRAAERYRAAFAKTGGYFSAINAATTTLLGGDVRESRVLADKVLKKLEWIEPQGPPDRYYALVSEAEAALLLEDTERASHALLRADALLKFDLNARGRTRQQLRRVCRALKLDLKLVDRLHVPPVIYLPSLHPGDRAYAPTSERPLDASVVYTGITTTRQLEAAESLLMHSARLHVVLAAPRTIMLQRWEAVHGAQWARRLSSLIEQAYGTSVALGFLDDEDDWCERYVGAMALGLSRLAAHRLGCDWCYPDATGKLQSGVDASRELETAAREIVAYSGRSQRAGAKFDRRFAGVIFADFAGFSRLGDQYLPAFWAQFMRAIGERLEPHRRDVLLQRTWGDALHVVTANARAAAEIACEIQDCLEQLRPTLTGPLARLELRLSAHFAPVFGGTDPVEDEHTFFGSQLSFTARIEPVTPPGMVFVTESFAAQIALEAPAAFAVEYAGEVALAKSYGESRLFNLRRTLA